MSNNPFTSSIFERIWSKHYCKGKTVSSFGFIEGVKFTKSNSFPIYENLGKNLTNGITYDINSNSKDLKNKIVLIYDVPSYFDQKFTPKHPFRIEKISQYGGCYGDLSAFKTPEDILNTYFNSSKSKYNFRRSLKQLDEQINARYEVYFGSMSKKDYIKEMARFKELLGKRFDDKNEFNTILPMWDFYEELIYPMILEKKVALNVIYNDDQPIAMSINFINDKTLIVAIRTFDIDYNKMNIGNIEVYKLIEWCINNGIEILDFSKGESDYKKRWTDSKYVFEHHVIYDSSSITANAMGKSIASLLKFKHYLRTKNVNGLYVKLKHIKRKILFQN